MKTNNRTPLLILLVVVAAVVVWQILRTHPNLLLTQNVTSPISNQDTKLVNEQSAVIDVVKKVGPSVVTVGIDTSGQPRSSSIFNDPFGIFQQPDQPNQSSEDEDNYIGSGFIVSKDGLVVTNKHVVSEQDKYFVVDANGKKYTVGNIYRDPLNDLAILKISNPPAGGFKSVAFGDSDKIEVGQFAIAIGTALGQFRNTVTTGVVSGVGRGISAGSPYEGFVEQLDNVIQTDAAISPGNSGGPLLNSAGQVVGINTAVASQGQNIGFAIPINLVKQSIEDFNKTGQFNRAFLGVSYVLISRQAAVVNEIPQGALVREITSGSPAESAGIQVDDIITQIDNDKITDKNTLANIVNKKKVGQKINLKVYRDGKAMDITATLAQVPDSQ